jgi:hypothetical protein
MTSTFGTVLKEWRSVRRMSQLDLGSMADVSPRAAGFAPIYETHDPGGEAMAPIRDAIAWTLERHDPFPAIVIDRHWNVVDSNRAAVTMFAFFGVDARVNMIDLFIDEGGIRTSIENWPEVGYFLLTRLRTESYAVGGDEILDAAIATLAADPPITPPSTTPLPPARIRLG